MKAIAVLALVGCVSTLAAASQSATAPELTADQIVERNVAARGGLDAWRKVQTMVWVGHVESADAPAPSLPFVLELKRPNKTRFEIKTQGQAAVRMFDGVHGWKWRSSRSGKAEAQPYTNEELRFAHDGQGIEGPLIDYQVKGIAVALEGVDEVEGHQAYRLNVRLPSGTAHHVWIDAQTFLDVKYDRASHNAVGQANVVSVFYRNYQAIEGLQVPLVIESGMGMAKPTDRMVIDKLVVNPPLTDRTFARPDLPGHGRTAGVDIAASRQPANPMARPLPVAVPDALRLRFQSPPGAAGAQ